MGDSQFDGILALPKATRRKRNNSEEALGRSRFFRT